MEFMPRWGPADSSSNSGGLSSRLGIPARYQSQVSAMLDGKVGLRIHMLMLAKKANQKLDPGASPHIHLGAYWVDTGKYDAMEAPLVVVV